MSMSLTMTQQREHANPPPAVPDATWKAAQSRADVLLDHLASDPAALEALRSLILEGLEGPIMACDDDDAWLASLADGIRSRAAARG